MPPNDTGNTNYLNALTSAYTMINGDIQGASLSVPHAAVAVEAGLKVLLRTGDYIPRAGGTIWCSLRNTMQVCCWVSPDHSTTSTGSDTVGKPTSITSRIPRALCRK